MKKEEALKVGRPKLADKELLKDSWIKVSASLALAFVVGTAGVLTMVPTSNVKDLKGSVALNKRNVRVIEAKKTSVRKISATKTPKRIINSNGTVTRVIPAVSTVTKSISVD